MSRDRSVRMLVAAILFVAALFLAMSYLVEGRNLVEWWLPLALFIVGLAVLLLSRPVAAEQDTALVGGARTYTVREYTFPDRPAVTEAPESVGPEQAGEVNVREPVPEAPPEPATAPETLTPPVAEERPADSEPVVVPEASAPTIEEEADVAEEAPEEKMSEERVLDDLATAGEFAPPSSAEGMLNPPTESDSVEGAVVQHEAPPQQKDPARHEMPLQPHEVEKPEQTQAERLEEKDELLQPADTAENEFQSGEHVASDQPTRMPPPTTITTGEGAGEGTEPIAPEEKEVLDTTAAPPQPEDAQGVSPSEPSVAEAVLSDDEDDATAEGLAPSEHITTTPASAAGPDNLTLIYGIGGRMQEALRGAGFDSFTKLAAASDEELQSAIEASGMRLAPTLTTWREQASFLARGDRAGFEALVNALRGETAVSHEPDDDQKDADFKGEKQQ